MSIQDWIKEWWPLVVLGFVVIVLVGIAYVVSSDWAVEPLDGVSAAGSLLLSVFLLYIYHRQNKILEHQQDIMESEEEIHETAHVSPRLAHDWNLIDGSEIMLNVINTGADDAYNLQLVTEIEYLNLAEQMDLAPATHSIDLISRLSPEQEIKENIISLEFKINIEDRSQEVPFFEASKLIWEEMNDAGSDTEIIKIHVFLKAEDARGEILTETIAESGRSEIDGPSVISKHSSSRLSLDRVSPPRLAITVWGVMPSTDSIALTVENRGDMPAHNLSLFTELDILVNDEWIPSVEVDDEGVFFEGTELNVRIDTISDEEDFIKPIRLKFDDNGVNTVDFEEFTEKILDAGFHMPIRLSFKLEYDDGLGYSPGPVYQPTVAFSVKESDRFFELNELIRFEKLVQHLDSDRVVR